MTDKTDGADFLVGFFIGALAGAAAALLLAPQSGEETRALIREKGIELQERADEASADARRRAAELQAQTKEHVFLARTLGVNQLIVYVNKMDMANYDEARFNKLKEEVSALLKTVGYKPEEVPFIPGASLNGDNVAKAIIEVNPYFVDVSSGVETNGVKDPIKIQKYIDQAVYSFNK